jgi:hypothetical protein
VENNFPFITYAFSIRTHDSQKKTYLQHGLMIDPVIVQATDSDDFDDTHSRRKLVVMAEIRGQPTASGSPGTWSAVSSKVQCQWPINSTQEDGQGSGGTAHPLVSEGTISHDTQACGGVVGRNYEIAMIECLLPEKVLTAADGSLGGSPLHVAIRLWPKEEKAPKRQKNRLRKFGRSTKHNNPPIDNHRRLVEEGNTPEPTNDAEKSYVEVRLVARRWDSRPIMYR